MTAQGRMLQFKYLFPWVYACWIWMNRLGLRVHWLLVKPIRVRLADIWTVSAVAAACGVILAILLFVYRGAQSAEAQQPLNLTAATEDDLEQDSEPTSDAFIPAALAAYQPSTPIESSIPVQSSIPTQPMGSVTAPRITIRQNSNLQTTLHRTLLPVGWDQRESMELVSIPDPQVEPRLFDPRDPWRLASMLPTSSSPPFNSYVQRVGRLDAAALGPSLVAPSEEIFAFDPVSATENPLISVTKHVPEHVRRGERLAYEIVIENLTLNPLESVLVEERISALDRVESVEPQAKVVDDVLWWELSLHPRESRTIRIELRPNDVGSVTSDVDVTVVSRIGATTRVSEAPQIESPSPSIPDVEHSVAQQPAPMVDPFPATQPLPPRSSIPVQPTPTYQPQPRVSMTMGQLYDSTVGREWSTVFTLVNEGDATAYDVRIDIALPRHFRHRHGTAIRHQIAELAPGDRKTATLIVVAELAGNPHFVADLSVGNVVMQQEVIDLSIAPARPVEQASFQSPGREEPRPCSTSVYLVRPGCPW